MPSSRNRKKKSKRLSKKNKFKPYEVVKQKMWMFEPPDLGEMPFQERLQLFLNVAEDSSEKFEQHFEELKRYFREYDPLYLISFCAIFFVSKPEGIDEEAIEGKLEFPPFFLEIMQCIALFQERPNSFKPMNEETGAFKNTMKELNNHQKLRYYGLVKGMSSAEDMGAALLRMDMMLHTLAVRNWAHIHQMRKVSYDLAKVIRKEFKEKLGFDPVKLLDIIFCLDDLATERLRLHIAKLKKLLTAKNLEQAFSRAQEVLPEVDKPDEKEQLELWEYYGKNLKNLTFFLALRLNMNLADVYTFSSKELLAQVQDPDLDVAKISGILDLLSYNFGDLAGVNKDHIFLDNPVHKRPFIKVEDDKYFSILPFLMPHLSIGILENFLLSDSSLKEYYHERKGKYLESELEKLFTAAFPTAKIYSGSKWESPESSKGYENDLLVIQNDFALVIEAKSGSVTAPAKRGAPNRLFESLKELIVEPSEQAIRFQNFLKERPQMHRFKTKRGVINSVDVSGVKYFVPIGLTLSTLGSIGCNMKKLIHAKVIELPLSELAPSITFTDLQLIFNVLDGEAEMIHYLCRRREFTAHVSFEGDEIDLLGFYLETGFNIGDDEYNEEIQLGLTLKSKEVDPYFMAKERGVTIKKPELQKTKYWKDLLHYLRAHNERWLRASFMLLNATIGDQIEFEKNLNKLKKMVSTGNVPKPVNWLSCRCGPERRRYTIVAFVYKGIFMDELNGLLKQITDTESAYRNRGLIILGYSLDFPQYPVSFIAGILEDDFLDVLD